MGALVATLPTTSFVYNLCTILIIFFQLILLVGLVIAAEANPCGIPITPPCDKGGLGGGGNNKGGGGSCNGGGGKGKDCPCSCD